MSSWRVLCTAEQVLCTRFVSPKSSTGNDAPTTLLFAPTKHLCCPVSLQTCQGWRTAFGTPPDAAAWDSRPAPLQQILLRLQEAGHIQPALAPAIDHLAGRLLLRPTAHGNFVAAVLVAGAQAARLQQAAHQGAPPDQQQQEPCLQQQVTIRQAVAAVKAAGGSASLGRTGAMLRRLLASWQVGGINAWLKGWCAEQHHYVA